MVRIALQVVVVMGYVWKEAMVGRFNALLGYSVGLLRNTAEASVGILLNQPKMGKLEPLTCQRRALYLHQVVYFEGIALNIYDIIPSLESAAVSFIFPLAWRIR